MEKVYEGDAGTDPNSLGSDHRLLRRKIGHDMIETVRGSRVPAGRRRAHHDVAGRLARASAC